MKVKLLSCVWHFATPWTVAYQAPQSVEFSRQEYWSGLPFPSSGDLPNPGIEPGSPTLQADTLPSEPPGKPKHSINVNYWFQIGKGVCQGFMLSPCSFNLYAEWTSEVAQLCLTLCNPMDCSLPGSSIHGIFQARVLEWVAIAYSSSYICYMLWMLNSVQTFQN